MADIEDEAEFGSHFLDSMLEVEMTEDDNEIDVSKNCDPLETLPPVPTFDLQSETLSYKDVYKNSIPQPVLATLPVPDASKVPAVLNPSSMLVLSGESPTQKPVSVRTIVPKISPKQSAKSLLKTAAVNTQSEEKINDEFIQEVFRPEFVQNVFVEADTHTDIALVSEEEMEYYKTCFKDVSNVKNCRLHCTICDKHLGCAMSVEKKISVHSMLQVLTCKPCYEFYGDGNFPCDKGDNCEIYCRWCGQGGALVCCSFCPRVFCKKCVKRNYGPSFLKSIEKASDWACFCCAQKPLWPHRAICRALLEFFAQRKTDPTTSPKDATTCCKGPGLARKRLRAKNDLPPTPLSQPKTLQIRNKSFPSTKQPKGHFVFTPPLKPKIPDTPRSVSTRASKPPATPSIFSSRSILTGNAIIRGIATTNTPKFISSLPASQLLQSPVLHGETLITPPARLLLQAKSRPTVPATPNFSSSFVRVSLTNQVPNVDLSKIPTVKMPHEVQGLVLRLIFPDNRMQYVRLASDGSGCKAGKEFPMPQFPERGACFVEENLAEAFKVCKTMYEKLSQIREKVNSRTKFTEESVFNSSVKKLHLAYEKTVDLFKELDGTLLENQAEWKKGGGAVDVIDISDDDGGAAKKAKVERAERASRYATLREKCRSFNADSDVEILEDIAMNGKTPANTNFKEKYRLRSGPGQVMKESSDEDPPKKRKRGRPRKDSKRPRLIGMQNGRSDETSEERSEETSDEKSMETVDGKSEQTTPEKSQQATHVKMEQPSPEEMEQRTHEKSEQAILENMEQTTQEKMEQTTHENMEQPTHENMEQGTHEKSEQATHEKPEQPSPEKSEQTTHEKMEQTTDEKSEEVVDGKSEETVKDKSKEAVDGIKDCEPAAEIEPEEEVAKPWNQTTDEGAEGAKEGDAAPVADSIQQET